MMAVALKLPFINDPRQNLVISQKITEIKNGAWEMAQQAGTLAARSVHLSVLSGPTWSKELKLRARYKRHRSTPLTSRKQSKREQNLSSASSFHLIPGWISTEATNCPVYLVNVSLGNTASSTLYVLKRRLQSTLMQYF